MRRLALVGGGHAHIEIVRRWGLRPIPGVDLTVIDPNPRPVYSGMVPGFVAGEYRREELEIDLAALCGSARAVFVQDAVTQVDPRSDRVRCAGGGSFSYDVASIDIGSTVAGRDLPGVLEHALASRPIEQLVSSIDGLVERAVAKRPGTFAVHVVGGGAGGLELAFCLEARLRRAGSRPDVAIVTEDDRLLPGGSSARSRMAMREAGRRGIRAILGARVAGLDGAAVRLRSGEALATDAVLWVTGPAAHSLATDSSLPVDADGFIEATATLQVVGHPNLFAVGDCASLPGMKRAGVYAVRSAPLLDHNLRARLGRGGLRRYRPQRDFLSILNLGDGSAIATKWGLATRGRAILWIKDRIDRSFMARYRF